MKFKDYLNYLNESTPEVLYHGQRFKGDPFKSMKKYYNQGNQQEGPGIYFGSLEVANDYGPFVYKTVESLKNKLFLPSRKSIGRIPNFYKKVPVLLKELFKLDEETMFYQISDWIPVSEPEEIEEYHIEEFASKLKDEELRNFLITYADLYGGDFLDVFNKVYPKVYGTFNKELNFYAFLKPVKVELINT
jgi:hypothetical protein